MIKTLSVAPAAATEEIVCPDARCLPHLLNSLPETDDAVPNYVGVYKGQSYVAPIRALVDSVLMDSLNSMYRDGKVPTVVNYRDIESVPVVQKENCQKVAVTSMPTLAKAMTTALPAAPVGYEPNKVMTTDENGDVYLATPAQLVSPGLVPAIIDNCKKGLIKNVPVIDRILGFGADCAEFGATTLKQLQEALAAVVSLAPAKILPDTLRGYKAGVEYKFPVSLNAVQSKYGNGRFSGIKPSVPGRNSFGVVTGPDLGEGLWLVTINMNSSWGSVAPALSYASFGMSTTIGEQAVSAVTIPGMASVPSIGLTASISKIIQGPLSLKADLFAFPGQATQLAFEGEVVFSAQEISRTNVIINNVA
jgi:hypothetical protein